MFYFFYRFFFFLFFGIALVSGNDWSEVQDGINVGKPTFALFGKKLLFKDIYVEANFKDLNVLLTVAIFSCYSDLEHEDFAKFLSNRYLCTYELMKAGSGLLVDNLELLPHSFSALVAKYPWNKKKKNEKISSLIVQSFHQHSSLVFYLQPCNSLSIEIPRNIFIDKYIVIEIQEKKLIWKNLCSIWKVYWNLNKKIVDQNI